MKDKKNHTPEEEPDQMQKDRPMVLSDDDVDAVSGGDRGIRYDSVQGYSLNKPCGRCQSDCWTYAGGPDMYYYYCSVCNYHHSISQTTTPYPPSHYRLTTARVEA